MTASTKRKRRAEICPPQCSRWRPISADLVPRELVRGFPRGEAPWGMGFKGEALRPFRRVTKAECTSRDDTGISHWRRASRPPEISAIISLTSSIPRSRRSGRFVPRWRSSRFRYARMMFFESLLIRSFSSSSLSKKMDSVILRGIAERFFGKFSAAFLISFENLMLLYFAQNRRSAIDSGRF